MCSTGGPCFPSPTFYSNAELGKLGAESLVHFRILMSLGASMLASSQNKVPRRVFSLQRAARGPGDTPVLLTDKQTWMTLGFDYSCSVMVFFLNVVKNGSSLILY